MVRLLPRWRRSWKLVAVVSIPQWCDCCPTEALWVEQQFKFQSHNGAIAAFHFNASDNPDASFQSHNGAIAAQFAGQMETVVVSFNPTMVRLLLGLLGLALACHQRFNPTMVRLLLNALY